MAARRGKTQARRNQGNSSGLPGWAWMVMGIVLTIAVVLLAPRWLKADGDGFFRPQPNPDARPAQASDDELAAPETDDDRGDRKPRPSSAAAVDAEEGPEFDFYTLLPGKEVQVSDAELAATERAEAKRLAQQAPATSEPAVAALPDPVAAAPAAAPKPVAATPTAVAAAQPATAAGAGDGTRYLLQAGAFQASGQAEELKARIAMLGLGARVESANIQGKTVYRVRMGPYGTASDLADAKRKLANGGLPGMAIKVQ